MWVKNILLFVAYQAVRLEILIDFITRQSLFIPITEDDNPISFDYNIRRFRA